MSALWCAQRYIFVIFERIPWDNFHHFMPDGVYWIGLRICRSQFCDFAKRVEGNEAKQKKVKYIEHKIDGVRKIDASVRKIFY